MPWLGIIKPEEAGSPSPILLVSCARACRHDRGA